MEEVKHDITQDMALVNYIVLARIYDVLMAQLRDDNKDVHDALFAAHSKGILLAPPPAIVQDGPEEPEVQEPHIPYLDN